MADTISVQGQDGKSYEFSARQKVKKDSSIQPDNSIVTKFIFRNGVVREAVMPRDSALFVKAAAHGLDQKYGDEFAGLDDVEDCVEAFDALAARLARGEWSEKRVSDGMAGTSLLVRALAEVSGGTIETVKAKLANASKEQKAALARQAKVAAVISRIKAERDAKKGKAEDADAALAEFLG